MDHRSIIGAAKATEDTNIAVVERARLKAKKGDCWAPFWVPEAKGHPIIQSKHCFDLPVVNPGGQRRCCILSSSFYAVKTILQEYS